MVRGPTALDEGQLMLHTEVAELAASIRKPKSTLAEIDRWRGDQLDHPLFTLFRVLHGDIVNLLLVIQTSVDRIRKGGMDEAVVQENVLYWRSLLNQFQKTLADMKIQLPEFARFVFVGSQSPRTDFDRFKSQIPKEYRELIEDALGRMGDMIEVVTNTNDSLRAEMQIIDNRRSIAEAESVSKLTELAFIFIPLTFATSLFSVQAKELGDGVPFSTIVLICLAFVILAYCMRLAIRSQPILQLKASIFDEVREQAGLHSTAPVPTRVMLRHGLPFASGALGVNILRHIRYLVISTPYIAVLAAFAAMLTPIIFLWRRNIDNGFSVVITLLFLMIDGIIVYPIVDAVRQADSIATGLQTWWYQVSTMEGRLSNQASTRRKRVVVTRVDVEMMMEGYSIDELGGSHPPQ
jgi:hypothetical protein